MLHIMNKIYGGLQEHLKNHFALPPKTKDTIYRKDYWNDDNERKSAGSTRHSANPNKQPALGTEPNDGDQRLYKENISYEHQYDSRIDQNYPRRGKRHGSFVWKQMSPEESRSFVDRQVSELHSETSLPNPLIGEGENMVKFKNGEMTTVNTRSPTNLTKEKSPELGCKSVSFVDDKNDGGVDAKPVQSGLNIAENGHLDRPFNNTQVVNHNNNNEISENMTIHCDNQNKPISKNGNRNGTIKVYNGVEAELMESLGLN
ncbi:hypothetical protein KUTeg_011298 [Tegillarca granosa]|uniref:Uncharacterized protein n=1 Tax=Tegillarca granosa TaxID=220873 RepID=A0ABQ9F168_TEGGR|nr:hypothetical protein KUTeg_011298 [Tegillarca granosa]